MSAALIAHMVKEIQDHEDREILRILNEMFCVNCGTMMSDYTSRMCRSDGKYQHSTEADCQLDRVNEVMGL